MNTKNCNWNFGIMRRIAWQITMFQSVIVKAVAILAAVNAVLASTVGIQITKPVADCKVKAENGNDVTIHYTGRFTDGKEFDSSIPRDAPITFELGSARVIPGWDQGLVGMCLGEKRTLTIPSDLAYGSAGIGPIPPNADLIFDVELVYVTDKSKDEF